MGYDCTLHAVDEQQLSGLFVDALLSETPPPSGSLGDIGVEGEFQRGDAIAIRQIGKLAQRV